MTIHTRSRRSFLGASTGAVAGLALRPGRLLAAATGLSRGASTTPPLRVQVNAQQPVNAFDPDQSLGTCLDEYTPEEMDQLFHPEAIQAILSQGWGPVSYRNNTELIIQAWHWNPTGVWSNPAGERGYFTGTAELGPPIRNSYGYDLPHRGSTRVSGGKTGFSRLTDGDPTSFWKSNPYLTRSFTGQDDAEHPQWVVVDLLGPQRVNAVRIDWSEPSARVYSVEYWTGQDPMTWEEPGMNRYRVGGPQIPVSGQANGRWNQFPNGAISDGNGGSVTLKLCNEPVEARWFRVVMTQSSNRPGPHAEAGAPDRDDLRHRSGYAIHEISIGTLLPDGQFVDLVQHSADQNQTPTFCSSIDPYHAASNRFPELVQIGMDLFYTSGITNQRPAMMSTALLYSTPQTTANQILYLKRRGYAVDWIEIGEEPDGQYCMPEDYAELYIQFAEAIHKVVPEARLGGPVLRGINQDPSVWPDAENRTSWMGRFVDYLKRRGHLQDLAFVSIEHYPFDPCNVNWGDLLREPAITRTALEALRNDGVPASVPLMITESGDSWGASEYNASIFSALWLADSVGSFFRYGGSAYYHFPMWPTPVRQACHGFSTWASLIDGRQGAASRTALYHAGQLVNQEWAIHGVGLHQVFEVAVGSDDLAEPAWITAYALRRPNREWSLLLVNKLKDVDHPVQIAFQDPGSDRIGYFEGLTRKVTFGSQQYVWRGATIDAHAEPDRPPVVSQVSCGRGEVLILPRSSVTVLRGHVSI